MSKQARTDEKYIIRIVTEPPRWHTIPKRLSRYVTRPILVEEGFKPTVGRREYAKSFSGVMEMRVYFAGGDNKFYDWSFNESALIQLNRDLESIKTYIDVQAEELYRLMKKDRSQESSSAGLPGDSKYEQIRQQTLYVAGEVAAKRRTLAAKYAELFELFKQTKIETPYLNQYRFFFDACKTTSQLNLYFDFIRLLLECGAEITDYKRPAKLSSQDIRRAIFMYHFIMEAVRRVRARYRNISPRRRPIKKLQEQFADIPKALLKDMTCSSYSGRGYEYRAKDFALSYICRNLDVTSLTFEQHLKDEKNFSAKVKKQMRALPDLDTAPTLAASLNVLPLKRERLSRRDYLERIKRALAGDPAFVMGAFQFVPVPFQKT